MQKRRRSGNDGSSRRLVSTRNRLNDPLNRTPAGAAKGGRSSQRSFVFVARSIWSAATNPPRVRRRFRITTGGDASQTDLKFPFDRVRSSWFRKVPDVLLPVERCSCAVFPGFFSNHHEEERPGRTVLRQCGIDKAVRRSVGTKDLECGDKPAAGAAPLSNHDRGRREPNGFEIPV